MANLAQKRAAERDARAMLEDHGLPQPDEVEYGRGCIWLLWREDRFCLEIEIDGEVPGMWTDARPDRHDEGVAYLDGGEDDALIGY